MAVGGQFFSLTLGIRSLQTLLLLKGQKLEPFLEEIVEATLAIADIILIGGRILPPAIGALRRPGPMEPLKIEFIIQPGFIRRRLEQIQAGLLPPFVVEEIIIVKTDLAGGTDPDRQLIRCGQAQVVIDQRLLKADGFIGVPGAILPQGKFQVKLPQPLREGAIEALTGQGQQLLVSGQDRRRTGHQAVIQQSVGQDLQPPQQGGHIRDGLLQRQRPSPQA